MNVDQDPFPNGNPPDQVYPAAARNGLARLDDGSGLRKMREPFPPQLISKLKKRFKNKATGEYAEIELDYVGHADITARLLDADPYWSWEPMAVDPSGLPAVIVDNGHPVGLWIRLTVCGVTRIGYGSCEPGKADAVKELIGDALRNAAMRFGAGLELWSKAQREAPETHEAPVQRPEPVSASAQRHAPPGQPQEEDWYTKEVATAFGGTVQGEPKPRQILGVTVPHHDMADVRGYKLPFGKFKSQTLGSVMESGEGRGWLDFLAGKISEKAKAGDKLYKGDYLLLLAWDALQGTAPI